MTEAEAKIMVEAKLRCMELEDLACIGKGCDRNCDDCNYNYMQGTVGEHKEALRMAIKALEKQIAKKPRFYAHNYYCTECGNLVGNNEFEWQRFLYCDNCGQKLDWSEV